MPHSGGLGSLYSALGSAQMGRRSAEWSWMQLSDLSETSTTVSKTHYLTHSSSCHSLHFSLFLYVSVYLFIYFVMFFFSFFFVDWFARSLLETQAIHQL